MPVSEIVFIRHAEEHGKPGIDADGGRDDQGLTVRGWQRAGELARFFAAPGIGRSRPDVVYSSCVRPGSPSRRPQQTVAPLLPRLREEGDACHVDEFAKHGSVALMADVLARSGIVLVCWEHSVIADCIACIANPPDAPAEWPSGRYDLLCISRPKVTAGASAKPGSAFSPATPTRRPACQRRRSIARLRIHKLLGATRGGVIHHPG